MIHKFGEYEKEEHVLWKLKYIKKYFTKETLDRRNNYILKKISDKKYKKIHN